MKAHTPRESAADGPETAAVPGLAYVTDDDLTIQRRPAKRNLRTAIEQASTRLGNTPTTCRKCYVHPEIVDCHLEDRLAVELDKAVKHQPFTVANGLDPEEAAVLALLQHRRGRAVAHTKAAA